jgi:hypothetical protein
MAEIQVNVKRNLKCSFCHTDNAVRLHYKHQPINAVRLTSLFIVKIIRNTELQSYGQTTELVSYRTGGTERAVSKLCA